MTTTSSRLPSASLGPDQAESTSRFLQRLAWARPAIQLGVLAVVLAPLWWTWVGHGPSFYQGNFASGRLQIGSWWIPMSDPFTALSFAVSSRTVPFGLFSGAMLILGLYLLVRARTFCSFACPIHLVLEVWDRLLVRWKIRNEKIGEEWPWWTNASMAALLIVASGMVGMPIYEPINPINTLVRSVQHVALGGLGLVAAVMVFEACAGRRLFCRHLCPVGGFYGMVNRLGFAGVAVDPQTCTGCRRCVAHCLAAPELEAAIVAARQREIQTPRAVESMHCTFCLDCAARCDRQGIILCNRWRARRHSRKAGGSPAIRQEEALKREYHIRNPGSSQFSME